MAHSNTVKLDRVNGITLSLVLNRFDNNRMGHQYNIFNIMNIQDPNNTPIITIFGVEPALPGEFPSMVSNEILI